MSNDNNILSEQFRRQGSITSGAARGHDGVLVSGSDPAPCTGRCPSCGRTVEAGDLMLRLGDQFVHGCRGHLRLAGTTATTGDGATILSGPASVSVGTGDGGGGASWSAEDGCGFCYPNHMEVLNRPLIVDGQCRFDVRFPGFTLDVVATTLAEAGWAAEEAVREHYPSETIEIRCATRRGCDHPDQWVPAWTVM